MVRKYPGIYFDLFDHGFQVQLRARCRHHGTELGKSVQLEFPIQEPGALIVVMDTLREALRNRVDEGREHG